MRITKLLLLSTMLTHRAAPSQNCPYFSSGVYGPFSNGSNTYATFSVVGSYDFADLTVRYYYHNSGALIANESYSLQGQYFPYTIRSQGKLNAQGLRIEFTIDNGYKTNTQTIILYPTNPETIYSYLYKDSTYYSYYHSFKITGKTTVRNYECYNFVNTIDYLTNASDNSLRLDEIVFNYDDGNNLINPTNDKYLRFKDEDNLFIDIASNDDGYKYIPIKCVQSGQEVGFAYRNYMYYDPLTFRMSLNSKSGYERTELFYLPKTSLSSLEKYDFNIYMPTFGRSQNTVIIPLQFYKNHNYTGLCTNSNYCIVGGLKE